MAKKKVKICPLCYQGIKYVDYTDVNLLRNFISGQFSILPSKRTGLCRKHQKEITQAIKRARFLALLPFVRK